MGFMGKERRSFNLGRDSDQQKSGLPDFQSMPLLFSTLFGWGI